MNTTLTWSRLDAGLYRSNHGHLVESLERAKRGTDPGSFGTDGWFITYPGEPQPDGWMPTYREAKRAIELELEEEK